MQNVLSPVLLLFSPWKYGLIYAFNKNFTLDFLSKVAELIQVMNRGPTSLTELDKHYTLLQAEGRRNLGSSKILLWSH